MTENNQCFLNVDIHVMSWSIFLHHKYDNPTYLCLSQSDCVSLKPKNFYTGELCEHAETKSFVFNIIFVYYSFTTSLVESLLFGAL